MEQLKNKIRDILNKNSKLKPLIRDDLHRFYTARCRKKGRKFVTRPKFGRIRTKIGKLIFDKIIIEGLPFYSKLGTIIVLQSIPKRPYVDYGKTRAKNDGNVYYHQNNIFRLRWFQKKGYHKSKSFYKLDTGGATFSKLYKRSREEIGYSNKIQYANEYLR